MVRTAAREANGERKLRDHRDRLRPLDQAELDLLVDRRHVRASPLSQHANRLLDLAVHRRERIRVGPPDRELERKIRLRRHQNRVVASVQAERLLRQLLADRRDHEPRQSTASDGNLLEVLERGRLVERNRHLALL